MALTARQRDILKAISDGRVYQLDADADRQTLLASGFIRRVTRGGYVITEAGQRAIASSDGGH